MKNSRRRFLKTTAATTAGLAVGLNSFGSKKSYNIIGANEKIKMGFIGIGNRGSQLLNAFMQNKDCEVVALCDVYEPFTLRDYSKVHPRWIKEIGRIPKMGEKFTNKPALYKDYRKLLEDKNIDAVCIATPDHWHALQTIDALKAGKDVYVEKPLTATIHEGRAMINAQKDSKHVVAVGLDGRGSEVYLKLAKEIPNGKIGKISFGHASRIDNLYPNGIGKMKPENPPDNFDWDMWLGPRSFRPYQYNIAPYMFRWWHEYSSQMGNWGVHHLDALRWFMGETAPVAITASGGKYVLDHDGDIPDTMQVIFEFASKKMITYSILEGSTHDNFVKYKPIEIRGTKGTLYASMEGYQIMPTKAGQFQNWSELMEPEEYNFRQNTTQTLVNDFLNCVKTREIPLCNLEEAHRSTSFAHLANISLALKQRLEWDPVNEKFLNSNKGNELLSYQYRKPWKL